jgi:PAS domain S-box-containing protein
LCGLGAVFAERRKAELALAERNAQVALAGKVALVGSYTYDVNKGVMQISEGYAAIHGLPEGTTDTSYSEWRVRVHPDDLARAEGPRDRVFANRCKEDNAEYRIVLSTGKVRWIGSRGSISYNRDGRPQRVTGVNIDVTERKRVEEQQRVLLSELDHRVKNTLATVSAVVSHPLDASGSMADFATALDGRVQSMARAHELLSASRWQGISVAELVRRELAPYATTDNTEINGPEVLLRAEAGQVMAMVLHELATNAAKYGALSTQNGRVSIKWGGGRTGTRVLISYSNGGRSKGPQLSLLKTLALERTQFVTLFLTSKAVRLIFRWLRRGSVVAWSFRLIGLATMAVLFRKPLRARPHP